jgi:hypothetical protein
MGDSVLVGDISSIVGERWITLVVFRKVSCLLDDDVSGNAD